MKLMDNPRRTLLLITMLLTASDAVLMKPITAGASFSAGTPGIAPMQFMLISSPSEAKVTWTTLQNFESSDGRAFSLVDSGLGEPRGLAFDHKRGHLYIADAKAEKIFRYTVLADMSGSRPTLSTTGIRLTITQGHPVEWVTVDDDGNLFYTAPDTNNINMIESGVMRRIAKGEFAASALQIVSQKTLTAQQIAKEIDDKKKEKAIQSGTQEVDSLPTDPPEVAPKILSIYEAAMNPHVASPASLWAEGPDLYWTNTQDGKSAGTVVEAKVHPKSKMGPNGPEPFEATAVTNISKGAFGLGKTDKVMFFSRNGSKPETGAVTGLLLGTDITIDFVTSLVSPRALVWDKDQTMYVADENGGNVWSFPAGRMMANAPLTRTVTMKGAFGLVILSSQDPCFKNNKVNTHGAAAADENIANQVAINKEISDLDEASSGESALLESFSRRAEVPAAYVTVFLSLVIALWTVF